MKKAIILFLSVIISIYANERLSLVTSYDKALNFEAKVRSYEYQNYAKKEEIKQSKSRLYPSLSLESSAVARDYRLNYNGKSTSEAYYSVKLAAQMPIYHPEYINQIEQSELKYDYSNIYLEQLKEQLAYDVVDAFMMIVRAQNSLSVAQAYLEANRARYNQIKKMYDKRLANKMDLLASKVTYKQSKIKVNQEMQNIKLAKFKFKNLTGLENVNIDGIDLEKVDVTRLYIENDLNKLYASNLDVKKANLNIKLTKKQIKNSKYGHYPKVDLLMNATEYDSKNNNTDYDNDSMIMLKVKIPLYQGGYVNSDIAKYKYLLSAANEDLKSSKREIRTKFEEQMITLDTAKRDIVLYKEAIESAKLYLHAVNRGYENGLKNLIDIEDAKSKLFETKFKLIDSVYEYIKAYTYLLNLFGELNIEKLKRIDDIIF